MAQPDQWLHLPWHLGNDKPMILLIMALQQELSFMKLLQSSSMHLTTRKVVLLPSCLKSRKELRKWDGALARVISWLSKTLKVLTGIWSPCMVNSLLVISGMVWFAIICNQQELLKILNHLPNSSLTHYHECDSALTKFDLEFNKIKGLLRGHGKGNLNFMKCLWPSYKVCKDFEF